MPISFAASIQLKTPCGRRRKMEHRFRSSLAMSDQKHTELLVSLVSLLLLLVVALIVYVVSWLQERAEANELAKRPVVTLTYAHIALRRHENIVEANQYFSRVKVRVYSELHEIREVEWTATPAVLVLSDEILGKFNAYVLDSSMTEVKKLKRGDLVRVTCSTVAGTDLIYPYLSGCSVDKVDVMEE